MLIAILFLLISFKLPVCAQAPEATPSAAVENIFIHEFSETEEWVEIFNDNDIDFDITDWYFKDLAGNKVKVGSINLSPKSLLVIEFGKDFLNNNATSDKPEKLTFYTRQEQLVDDVQYDETRPGYNWSYVEGEWCLASPTKNSPNTAPCFVPTNTPQPTNLPTPSPTKTPTSTSTPTPTSAPQPETEVSITSLPQNLKQSQLFSAAFLVKGLKPDTEYYVKIYGGKDGDKYDVETKSGSVYLKANADWEKFPKYRTDGNGEINKALIGRIAPDGKLGEYLLRLKLKDVTSTRTAESPPRALNVAQLPPSATPSPDPDDLTPTSSEDSLETDDDALDSDADIQTLSSGNILGDSSDNTAGNQDTSVDKKAFSLGPATIPIIFMVGGGIMLAIPLAVTKFKKPGKSKPPLSDES